MSSLSRLNSYLLKYKYHLLWGTFFIILSNLLSIYPAQIVRVAFDLIKQQITLFSWFNHTSLEVSYYNLIAIFLGIFGALIILLALFRGLFMFLLVIISMVNVNPFLTIIVLTPLPLLAVLMYLVNHKINKHSEEIQGAVSELSTFTQEAFSGIRVLKSFSREQNSLNRFSILNAGYFKKTNRLTFVNAWYYPLLVLLIGLSTILTVYVGGMGVMDGSATTGNIAEFVLYVNMLAWPVTSLGWVTSLIQRAAVSQRRINVLLDQKNELQILVSPSFSDLRNVENESGKASIEHIRNMSINENFQNMNVMSGKISFKNVSFIFPDSGRKAISNISFELPANKTLGVTGNIGSGKSTLAGLICRFFDPGEGEIRIDDKPINELDIRLLRNSIGYVPQDVFLFSDTIYNNIAFGSTNATNDEVIEMAKQAGIFETIKGFNSGFETEIGERGITLSGGQKQRIAIARALIRQPRILILDDCLSAVDTKTENLILENLGGFIKNRTSVIISHRVSSLKFADYILVLDSGRIIEEGNFEELLKIKGNFYQLHESQLKEGI